jgi:hypothetical protein
MSLHNPTIQTSVEVNRTELSVEVSEETPEQRQKRDRELGLELFGQSHPSLHVPEQKPFLSSPMIQARQEPQSSVAKINLGLHLNDVDMIESSWAMTSPEQMDVDELDMLFTGF